MEGYKQYTLSSFSVYVEQAALIEHPNDTQNALDVLSEKLLKINELDLIDSILNSLHEIKIFLDSQFIKMLGYDAI